jgi:hypothetical protein
LSITSLRRATCGRSARVYTRANPGKRGPGWLAPYVLALALGCGEAEPDMQGAESPIVPDASNLAPIDAAVGVDTGVIEEPQASSDASRTPREAGASDAGLTRDAERPSADAGRPGRADASLSADAGLTLDASPTDPSTCAVQAIPETLRSSYRMGAIYKRYADANGVPVIASDKPADEAIRRACLLVLDYASVRADVRDALLMRKVRFIMMAKSEKTVNFPEYASLGDIDMRARGLGGVTDSLCAEENVLCERSSDRWRGESICVHEYAHTMHSGAWAVAIPNFNSRLQASFNAALAAGKYANTYAGEKLSEYLAEGVQDWYNTNLESATPNGIHNHINTRAELEQYDPTLYALLKEVLPDKPSFRDCYYYE